MNRVGSSTEPPNPEISLCVHWSWGLWRGGEYSPLWASVPVHEHVYENALCWPPPTAFFLPLPIPLRNSGWHSLRRDNYTFWTLRTTRTTVWATSSDHKRKVLRVNLMEFGNTPPKLEKDTPTESRTFKCTLILIYDQYIFNNKVFGALSVS